MNIWALNKDLAIKHLLLLLETQFPADSYLIDTATPTDPCSIYLIHKDQPRVKAYLFTLGQSSERYGVHLEFPAESARENLLEAYENLRFAHLADILAVHFDIAAG